MKKLSDLRQEYTLGELSEKNILPNPIEQFKAWMQDAIDARIIEPNAMVLATASPDGSPSARVVLLKEVTPDGFVFFTNYESRKGKEIIANPHVALVFDWHEMERQVRVEGVAEKISAEDSDRYFHSRPANSRLGAWASPQSQVIENRSVLEQRQTHFEQHYTDRGIERPPHWGGFGIIPSVIEFWQGRANRLHDRLVFQKQDEDWHICRLAP